MQIVPIKSHLVKLIPLYHGIHRLHKYSHYLISYSPTIYRKDFLLECLNRDESIWDSEVKGTKRLWVKAFFGRKYKIYRYVKDWYINAIVRGELKIKIK